jgi:sorbose reductase
MGSRHQAEHLLKRDADGYLRRTVQDLFSLEGRTIVITGGARGIGLSFAFAIAEVGGNIAILDALEKPHEHFHKLEKEFKVKVKFYRQVVISNMFCLGCLTLKQQDGCDKI